MLKGFLLPSTCGPLPLALPSPPEPFEWTEIALGGPGGGGLPCVALRGANWIRSPPLIPGPPIELS